MGLLESFEKLINEHGSATILREHLALVKAEQSALERKNADLQAEKEALQSDVEQLRMSVTELRRQLDALQTGLHSGVVCDHCGSPQLNRIGNRPDPTFAVLGVKQAVFRCLSCGKESAFTQD
jgi:predicted  nucleic acid-binding Zn-ribbon protein